MWDKIIKNKVNFIFKATATGALLRIGFLFYKAFKKNLVNGNALDCLIISILGVALGIGYYFFLKVIDKLFDPEVTVERKRSIIWKTVLFFFFVWLLTFIIFMTSPFYLLNLLAGFK